MKGAIALVQVLADDMPPEVNASALSRAVVSKRRNEQGAELMAERLVNKGPHCPIGEKHSANEVCLILNLLWLSCGYARPGIIERHNDIDRCRTGNGAEKQERD